MSDDVRGLAEEAWAFAHEAARTAGVELRPMDGERDIGSILRVMSATWGGHEPFPHEMFRALADSGNVPYLAFAGEEAVGYVLAWAGVEPDDGLHVHSHMLAALPDRRHRGVGYALKLAQRAQALEQGIPIVRWTFDPLVARNAYFNLHKLGAIADRFGRHVYGDMADTVNAGDRSDRLTVRWDLMRQPGPRALPISETILAADGDLPGRLSSPTGSSAMVEVPREYAELRLRDPALGQAWRDASADAIEACLGAGMVAADLDAERSAYLFIVREKLPA